MKTDLTKTTNDDVYASYLPTLAEIARTAEADLTTRLHSQGAALRLQATVALASLRQSLVATLDEVTAHPANDLDLLFAHTYLRARANADVTAQEANAQTRVSTAARFATDQWHAACEAERSKRRRAAQYVQR